MILDIMMPKKDGVQALQEIREKGDMTPVLMLTAKAEVDDRITGLDAGADDYLTKPFAMGELLARLRSLTRRSQSFTPAKLHVGASSSTSTNRKWSAAAPYAWPIGKRS